MNQPIIAVTGAAGFIGRHLTAGLVARGYSVQAIDLPQNLPVGLNSPLIQNRAADLLFEADALEALSGSDICIALAARSAGIGTFNRYPATMMRENSLIMANTLAGMTRNGIRRVIYVSSSCVFDRSKSYLATEEALADTPTPSAGYPFSKLIGEMLCRSYYDEFGVTFTILRPFNVYGPGELPGREWGEAHVIPDLLEKVISGLRPIPIFGSGLQTRSFTFISDIVSGIIAALENPNSSRNEDFNIGMPEETSVQSLLYTLWSLAGYEGNPSIINLPAFSIDPARRAVDISKAKDLLNWTPIVSLREGLAQYISWYRDARNA